ncbi:GvpL/GvpF family gas vesicle protein [Fictibacillus fluitans]|uniref:GvpL/GvpF family gas vesicle protein n=1 Tax=Fictibacillus fluitans TaxID=3058422 RepID=A0ABT8HXG9_9BACL|nr:GvpL/GvpF family gas vesicle protein [Fictibacillus sp. NE201]MDN4524942.1 GvpL/GvpF family gas vesicle protein [Fictibacillus sp. NE201]
MAQTATTFLYVYGICAAADIGNAERPELQGIGGEPVKISRYNGLAAILTEVDGDAFCQEQIDRQVKDADWLKKHAFHHHETVALFQQQFPLLPMSFCTIFEQDDKLQTLLRNQHDDILRKLDHLRGKQEWNIKMFCSPERLREFVQHKNPSVLSLEREMESMPKGKQFLMKKRLAMLVENELEREKNELWHQVITELEPLISEQLLRQNWGRDMTEITEEMVANCDVLIQIEEADEFFKSIETIEEELKEKGCIFHVTGPWPPYHFSKLAKEHTE